METKTRIESIMDPDNWMPNFTKISDETGVSVNAVREWYNKQIEKGLIVKKRHLTNVIQIKNVSEIVAMEGKDE